MPAAQTAGVARPRGRHAGPVDEEPAVAIVCQDGYATGWGSHDPHAVPFLLLADLLCRGLDLKAASEPPMRPQGEEQR